MLKKKLISSVLLPIAIILPALFPLGEATAQKQKKVRPTSLLKARCVKSGIGSARRQKRNVSIGRAVYSSEFYLGPGYRSAALTCNIQPQENVPQTVFQTLNLGFGMRDNNQNSPSVRIQLFLDGRASETITVAPTRAENVSVDVNNVNNVAIEATCSSPTQYCGRVYFYDADLLRDGPNTLDNNNQPPVEPQQPEVPVPPAYN